MIETNINGKTPDIAEENIQKLKQIFPDVFTEGKVDLEKLQQVLGNYAEDSNERYNFTWNGKGRALRVSQTPSQGTLRPCKEESKDWDTTQNLYVEGDNLEVLKLLQKSYHGKVKMIYIDPPYNTGKDFVYPDDFHDSLENYKKITGQVDSEGNKIGTNTEASGRYHTDWLNMMYPRLRLARNLLTDDGVIFISIDDNEVDNLKKICNEVFGEDNFVNRIAWVNNITGRQISGYGAAKTYEFILVYAKNINNLSTFTIPIKFAKEAIPDAYKGFNKDIRTDKRGEFAVGDTLYNHNRIFNEETRPNLVFSIYYNPDTGELKPDDIGLNKPGFIELEPHKNGDGTHKYHAWRWSRQKVVNESYDLIVLKTMSGGYEIYTKIREFTTTVLKDIITNISNGDTEFKQLFDGRKCFDYPKSTNLLKALLGAIPKYEDTTILDFFSGSATTAHAVMQLNAEDGGNRKFICVQLPELCNEGSEAFKAGYKNICEIGKERIRRAGDKIKQEKGLEAQNLDIGFKVLKLDTSNIRKWQPDYENLEQTLLDHIDNYVEGRTELDVVYEIMLKYGLDLTYPVDEFTVAQKKVYSIGFGMLMICLDDEITTEVAKGILAQVKELAPESTRVVFKDNGFKTDSNKTNIKEILKCGGIEEFITL